MSKKEDLIVVSRIRKLLKEALKETFAVLDQKDQALDQGKKVSNHVEGWDWIRADLEEAMRSLDRIKNIR